ncbi:MAG TPA: hypothetical protein VHE81_04435 [Lacipirellulaceae bacterium]|nr:hypothetical protein [Lacipirellulaceae bacterium]
MTNATRSSNTDANRELAGAAAWPVLARLPELSDDPSAGQQTRQSTSGALAYRFDPPQLSGAALNASASDLATVRVPQSNFPRQPHAFDRRRSPATRGLPRRESSILPRNNPFSMPRTRLADSVAPVIRFLTLVALFTAAGIWIQMMGRHMSPPKDPMEMPRTAQEPAMPPVSMGLDQHAAPAPTSAGPLDSSRKTGARVGRAGSDDFSTVEQSLMAAPLATGPTNMPPHFLVISGNQLPRVQTTDPKPARVEGDMARDQVSELKSDSDEPPAVAQRPGFLSEIPTR